MSGKGPFVPPFFGKFGGSANDLLNEKFDANKNDFRHGASIQTQANGFTLKSTATAVDENKLAASVNVTHADKQYGKSSFEVDTAGKAKVTASFTKLSPGLVVNNEAEFNTADPKSSIGGKVVAQYSQENIAVNAEYVTKKNTFLSAVVYGQDGISVGGRVTADLNALTSGSFNASKDLKPDVGVTYEEGNIVLAGMYDASKTTTFTAFHRVSGDFQLASKYVAGKNNVLSFGAQYKVDPSTFVKAKAVVSSDGSHAYYGYLKHSMANPNVQLGVSTSYNSEKNFVFGVKAEFK